MKKIITLIIALLIIPSVSAKTINHSYAEVGSDVLIRDDINGSSAIAGDKVLSEADIFGINMMAGNNIEMRGSSEYLAIAGNIISVYGNVKNDSFIAGNIVDIKKDATLNRDVIIAASDVEISGKIDRNLTVYAGKVNIKSAQINGNVRITSEIIDIDDKTQINGIIYHPKDAQTKIDTSAKIVKTKEILKEKETIFDIVLNKIWSALSLILIFALLTLLFPKIFEKIDKKYEKTDFNKIIETFSKGLVFLLLLPAISIFLLMLPFTLSLSLIITVIYIIMIYLSKIFTAYLIGNKVSSNYIKKDYIPLIKGIIGLALLFIIDFIPIFSSIVMAITIIFGIGIMIDLYKKK